MVALAHAHSPEPQTYYSRRDRHGHRWPIKVYDTPAGRSFEVVLPGGAKSFGTLRDTLAELHGKSYRTWGWGRYAGTGSYAVSVVGEPELTVVALADAPLSERLQGIVFAPVVPRGVDLAGRHREVAKLLYKGFGAQIYAHGYDFDDVLQEVFRKLVVSNQGSNPWDPTKSSFGHFVHMVCRSALYNLYRKDKKRREHERLGGYKPINGQWTAVDVADRGDLATTQLEPSDEALRDLSQHLLDTAVNQGDIDAMHAADLAVQALPYVREGYGRTEIATVLGLKPTLVSKGLVYLRTHAQSWMH
jgi:DNA-directed RNA polymerase specialized sigma24 family protein